MSIANLLSENLYNLKCNSIEIDGSSTVSGSITADTFICDNPPTEDNHLVNRIYVEHQIKQILTWKDPVISFRSMVSDPPVSPVDGDRYISDETGGVFTTNNIYEWVDSELAWEEIVPIEGCAIYSYNDNEFFVFTDSGHWSNIGVTAKHNALIGLQLAGSDVTYGHINDLPQSIAGIKTFTDTTASTSVSTGSLIISGGLGLKEKLHSGDTVVIHNITDTSKITTLATDSSGYFSIDASGNVIRTASTDQVQILNTTDSSDITTGSVIANGGLAVAKKVHTGDQVDIHNVSDTSKSTTLATDASGFFSIDASGNAIQTASTDQVQILNTTDSTSTTTGACVISGGLAVTKNLNVGGEINAFKDGGLYYKAYDNYNIGTGSIPWNNATGRILATGITTTLNLINPDYGGQANYYAVRFMGWIQPQYTELYTFQLTSTDDSAILFINNTEVVRSFNDTATGTISLTAGRWVPFYLEFVDVAGDAVLNVQWSSPSLALEDIPASRMRYNIFDNAPSVLGTSIINGILTNTNLTDSSSISTGSTVISGGLAVAKKVHAGDTVVVHNVSDTSKLTTLATDASGVFSIDASGNAIQTASTDQVQILSTTDSSSISTGALVVSGGLGVAGAVNIGAPSTISSTSASSIYLTALRTDLGFSNSVLISTGLDNSTNNCSIMKFTNGGGTGSTNNYGDFGVWGTAGSTGGLRCLATSECCTLSTTDSSSVSTGSLHSLGGLGVAKKIHSGDTVVIHNITDTSKTATLATDTSGYFSIDASGNVIQTASTDQVQILNDTDSSSISTGGAIISGGLGIAKKVHTGDTIVIHNNTDTSKTTTLATDASGVFSIDASGNAIQTASTDQVQILSTTDSTSISTGGAVISGGLAVAKKVHTGDELIVHCISDATKKATFNVNATDWLTVTSGRTYFSSPIYLPTDGGTAFGLNYYEEYTFETTCTGALVDNAVTIYFVRVGKNVTATIEIISDERDAADQLYVEDLVPARFRPVVNLRELCWVFDAGSPVKGTFYLSTGGVITWCVGTGTNFSAGTIEVGGTYSWRSAL